jgi:hypothetical protein
VQPSNIISIPPSLFCIFFAMDSSTHPARKQVSEEYTKKKIASTSVDYSATTHNIWWHQPISHESRRKHTSLTCACQSLIFIECLPPPSFYAFSHTLRSGWMVRGNFLCTGRQKLGVIQWKTVGRRKGMS